MTPDDLLDTTTIKEATMNTTTLTPEMIARRTKGGYALADTIALFEDLIANHDGDNLRAALAYNGFISAR